MLPTPYQHFIHLSRYSRWLDDEGRRESWSETVDRYFRFFTTYLKDHHDYQADEATLTQLRHAVLNLEVMPSMRALMTAGRALERDHVAGYNCAYVPVDSPRAFDEALFILACAAGVGFSVERQLIRNLPVVPESFESSGTVIVVRDSKRGWAEALRELVAMLYAGRVPGWNTDKVRPAGSRLRTMGGRASGPGPLVELFEFFVRVFTGAAGRRLTSVECHDLMCKVGDAIVVGGVRRAALLSLSNLSDSRMRDAKSGQWYEVTPWRAMSNNSVAYTEVPEVGQFMTEWLSLYNSKSGERGIFNREAMLEQAARHGRRTCWDEDGRHPVDFGTNPCGEIILRPNQFCNLTTVVARPDDEPNDLIRKVQFATILGTWQSCLTTFRYLRKTWRDNCEAERLLGVSITGIMDCPLLGPRSSSMKLRELLEGLRYTARIENRVTAEKLGIEPAAAITCVKPEGTASQLVGSSSGIHPAHSAFYARRVIQDLKDPLTHFMVDAGFPHEPSVTKPGHQVVFEFPMAAPAGSVLRDDLTAVQQLEHWSIFQESWCEHNPSITVTVREHEWPGVGAWVWDNFRRVGGIAFLPHTDHIYAQAPFQSVDVDTFGRLSDKMPRDVDWSKLRDYEDDDGTSGSRELACTAGACEI